MGHPFLWDRPLDPQLEGEFHWNVRRDEEDDGEEDEEGVESEDGEERPAEGPPLGGWDGPRDHEGEADGSDRDKKSVEGGLLKDEEERVDGEGGVEQESLKFSREGRWIG